MKFQRQATTNGVFLLSEAPSELKDIKAANCSFIFLAGDRKWKSVFFEKNLPVDEFVHDLAYGISESLPDGKFGGKCHINTNNRHELIYSLIEANKRFHIASLRRGEVPPKVAFGYLEDWAVPDVYVSVDSELVAKNLITQQTESGMRTINRLSYTNQEGIACTLTMCFDVTLLERD